MRVSEFDFNLPRESIAQSPAEPRDAARLLVLDRAEGTRTHAVFRDLPRFLRAGDLLVLNDTRVFPARLPGRRSTGGGIEALLLAEREPGLWEALLDYPRRLTVGETLRFGDGSVTAVIEGREGEPWLLRFDTTAVREALTRFGKAPLPPYIKRPGEGDPRRADDLAQYQTVYAAREGAVAAPTAGLHFTPDLLDRIRALGVETRTVTLHVGMGTFKPVKVEEVEAHRMLPERYEVEAETWTEIRKAKGPGPEHVPLHAKQRGGGHARYRAGEGRRVIAVGTTTVRVLETLARQEAVGADPCVRPLQPASSHGRGQKAPPTAPPPSPDILRGETDLFIHPPFEFQIVDAMVTNFHLPKSTLLMLVSALAGRERVLEAYREAVEKGYRFYSYGDAMFIQ